MKNTNLRTDMKYAGGSLRLTDPRILDAPLLIMTGHDKDITVGRNLAKGGPLTNSFSPQERAALRKYIIEQGGMLFFDDCGFNGLFAAIVADELQTIFPEYPLEYLPHHHELYNIYYQLPLPPSGGDVFWGSENQPKPTQFKYQKGITINKRLAVVYNRKDYMCAMETVEIESRTMLRLRRSTDVHRFMANLLVYAMKYGGNTGPVRDMSRRDYRQKTSTPNSSAERCQRFQVRWVQRDCRSATNPVDAAIRVRRGDRSVQPLQRVERCGQYGSPHRPLP